MLLLLLLFRLVLVMFGGEKQWKRVKVREKEKAPLVAFPQTIEATPPPPNGPRLRIKAGMIHTSSTPVSPNNT